MVQSHPGSCEDSVLVWLTSVTADGAGGGA